MQYQTYLPRSLNVSDDIDIEGVKWFCLEPCLLIGATIDGGLPVVIVDGEEEFATTQMIEASDCPSRPQPGLVRIANVTLMQYEKIYFAEMAGKQIKAAEHSSSEIIIVTTEKKYIKLVATYGDDFDDESLTMEDLWSMNLIGVGAWEKYQKDRDSRYQRNWEATDIARFKAAAAKVGLGMTTVEKLLEGDRS